MVPRRARQDQLAKVVPETCGIVWSVMRSQRITGAGRHVAVYLDCVINLEVGVELDTPFAGHGEVVGSATPSGDVVSTTHHGPYHLLHHAHQAIHQWCANNGRALAGPSWEIYGHWQDDWNRDPSKITTEVCYLLVEDEEARAVGIKPLERPIQDSFRSGEPGPDIAGTPSDGICAERLHPRRRFGDAFDTERSILREYQSSFFKLLGFSLIWGLVVLACLGMM